MMIQKLDIYHFIYLNKVSEQSYDLIIYHSPTNSFSPKTSGKTYIHGRSLENIGTLLARIYEREIYHTYGQVDAFILEGDGKKIYFNKRKRNNPPFSVLTDKDFKSLSEIIYLEMEETFRKK